MATEKRLIDANALIDWLSKHTGFRGNCEDCPDIDCLDCIIENAIKNAPEVDAVEVVRCKDCKHYHQYRVGKSTDLCEWGKCKLISMDVDMPENGYCCFGERKDND